MNTFIIIILFIASYLLGSIPGGYIVMKLVRNDDIRNHGSNSTGATNTTRVLGLKYGIIAAIIDILKGIVIPIILTAFILEDYYLLNIFNKTINVLPYYGIAAVLGHIFPIYLNFRGGKAVATSFGVAAFMSPFLTLSAIIIFVVVILITDYVSLASMVSALGVLIFAFLSYIFEFSMFNRPYIQLETLIAYLVLVTIIILRHIPNIRRLINKTESKVSKMGKR